MRLGLAGPSHVPYSESADSQRTVNLFPELVEGRKGKSPAVLYGTPGLETRVTLSGSNGIKAIFYDTSTRRTFVVKRRTNGSVRLSELTTTTDLADTEIDHGELSSTGGVMVPASISSNGLELFIVVPDTKKAHQFVLATDVLTEITSSVGNSNPIWGEYLDGYFIALDDNGRFYLSALLDADVWDGLDVATPESEPDPANFILSDHGQLWVFGTETVEIWINTGNPTFPFQPIKHNTIQMGLLYRYSVVAMDGRIYWVSRDRSGAGVVVEARGYQPQAVSNHAVTNSIQRKAVTGAEPVAWSHQTMGHYFYILTYPDDDLTWAYDPSWGRADGWHERMYLNGSAEESHRGRCCEYIGGEDGSESVQLVGDRANGKLYSLSMDVYDDDGDAIRRLRRSQHLGQEETQVQYHRLEVDVERGVEATYKLRWSNDGGKPGTWNIGRTLVLPGSARYNPKFRTLGSGRDRVFEFSSETAVKHAWIGAFLRLSPVTD